MGDGVVPCSARRISRSPWNDALSERPETSHQSLVSTQPFIPCYKNLLFHIFSAGAADISCCCHSTEVQIVGKRAGALWNCIDSDIIMHRGTSKNALLLFICVSWCIDSDIKSAKWAINSANKFRTTMKIHAAFEFYPSCKTVKNK